MAPEESPLLLTVEDGLATLTLNRPAALNALSRRLATALDTALGELAARPDLRVVVLRGAGERAFCTGADLKERATLAPAEKGRHTAEIAAAADALAALPVPSIAAVHGYALAGGLELALACDIRVAADDAVFGLTEVAIGIFPGAGGPVRLPQLVGPGKAKEMIFSGRRVDAAEALRCGLVEQVVPAADLDAAVARLAGQIRDAAPLAVRAVKRVLDATADMSPPAASAFAEALRRPLDATRDYAEGLAAFAARRKPRFTGE
ncbi:MAG TPA: enoyl-CoA hydratase-related protein [Thermomicrobiales bacterium]|nr:enoyl-CoA hydratase-related protein [Thermomicrobiales bacterium]